MAAAAASLLVPAFGQSSGGSTTGAGTTGSKPSLPTNTSSPTTSSGSLNQPTMARPLRVTGRVVIDDGSPLDFPAKIERLCSGNLHAEGYTDSDGDFSIILGQHPDVISDATETPSSSNRLELPSGIGQANPTQSGSAGPGQTIGTTNSDQRFDNCELVASLSGYTSDRINLGGRTSLDNPDVGNLVLHRMGASQTAITVTATTLKAPKAARKALARGLELAKKNKPEDAMASLQEAVKIYPEFAFAWCELGKLQLANDHTPDAHESFEAAVKAEPRWPEPYLHLAVMGIRAHDWNAVADNSGRVIKLNVFQYPQAYFLHGAASFNLHQIDIAEQDALAAEKLDVEHAYPQIEKLLGAIYAERHRYAEAAEKLRSYLLWAPDGEDVMATRQRLAEIEAAAASPSNVAQHKAQQ